MTSNTGKKILFTFIFMFLAGCYSDPVIQDNRAEEQKYKAEKAQQELSREIKKNE